MKLKAALTTSFGVVLIFSLSACTQQNWYEGAKQAQTANCMKQPLSDYEDCNQPADESYDEYSKNRDEVLEQKQ